MIEDIHNKEKAQDYLNKEIMLHCHDKASFDNHVNFLQQLIKETEIKKKEYLEKHKQEVEFDKIVENAIHNSSHENLGTLGKV